MGLPKRRATYEDLVSLPEHVVGELIDGEIFASPRPRMRHSVATGTIFNDLFGGFNGPPGDPAQAGGWWILFEPELHLGTDVLVPDLAGWRRVRLPQLLPDAIAQPIAPDWVCEVLSPSTGRLDRVKKMPIYAREGIGHLWIVDPAAHTLEIFRLEGDRWIVAATHADDDRARVEPFAAVELALGRWWLDG